jgi:hypothetical protein
VPLTVQKIKAAPEPGLATSARVYSPDRDQSLISRAADDDGFSRGSARSPASPGTTQIPPGALLPER